MSTFRYRDGAGVEAGDRIALEDGRWHGVVEACCEAADAAPPPKSGWPPQRGVLVRYDEVGLVFYPDEIEPDVVLVARAAIRPAGA